MSTQVLTELPNIQYAGMDYDNVIQEMKNIIKNNPNWAENWEEFYSSEAGVMFLQLMAWICDNLSTRQDALYNEQYLSTANKKSSKIRLLKTIGYKPALAHTAQVPINIEFENTITNKIVILSEASVKDSLSLRAGKIPRLSGLDINGRNTTWEILPISNDKPNYLDSLILNPGTSKYTNTNDEDKSNILYALQGETKYLEMYTDTSDGPYIDINDKNVAKNSIRVYIKSNNKECKEVDSFVSQEAISKEYGIPYIIELNENETLRIKFAPEETLKKERLLPADTTVSIFYRTTNGTLGNIPPKFLNTTYVFTDEKGEKHKAAVYNDTLAYGGIDNEELDNAVLNAPLTLRTLDRAVTPEDFDILVASNPNILKSKTYTASNIPDKFKECYGRYINPQEAFTFALLNKSYSNVPTKEYNNYPWITLIKQNRLNEKYSFGNGKINEENKPESTYYNLDITTSVDEKKFITATIINLGKKFNKEIDNFKTNPNFKLKINTNKSKEMVMENIDYNLLYPIGSSKETVTTLLNGNDDISAKDHARFITNDSYDKEEAIDVSKSRYINVSLDRRASIKIDLWLERDEGATGEYYLYWDNKYDGVPNGSSNKKGAAFDRNGIIQIINKQIVAISNGSGNVDELDTVAGIFDENTAYQYMGINKTEVTPIIVFEEGVERKDLILEINKKVYDFVFINEGHSITLKEFNDKLNDIFIRNGEVKKASGSANTNDAFILYDNEETGIKEWKTISEYNKIEGIDKVDLSKLEAGLCMPLGLDEVSYTSKDMYLKTKDTSMMLEGRLQISYNNPILPVDSPVVIINEIEYNNTTTSSMIHLLHMDETMAIIESVDYKELLGSNFPAVEYKDVASILEDPEDSKKIYFKMQSPMIGEESCIYFTYDIQDSPDIEEGQAETTKTGDGNFMKDFLKLWFDNKQISHKAIGMRRVCILKDMVINSVYPNKEGIDSFPKETISVGNIIFSNSCIYNNYDFKTLYCSYKFSDIKELEIGSKYDNFYYTGNEQKDQEIKELESNKFIKPTGVIFNNRGEIDLARSNIEIKFTREPVDNNFFYSIEDNSLNVVGTDKTIVLTKNIDDYVTQKDIPLVFSMDELSKANAWVININSVRTGYEIKDLIKKSIMDTSGDTEEGESIYEDYSNNVDGIVKDSYNSRNQIVLESAHATKNSNITFYYPSGDNITQEDVNEFYKNFLGTSATNKEFYELYPEDCLDDEGLIQGYDSEGNEIELTRCEDGKINCIYGYRPTDTSDLVLRYRKMVDGVSRGADYYIDYDSGRYLLHKTPNSKFTGEDFYMHVINDRSGTDIKTDEEDLNKFMNNKKISGMDLVWLQPYIKTYDIVAEIKYNANFSEDAIKSQVENSVKKLCSIENAEINGMMSKAKIIKEIMNCDGVENVTMNYFGLDYVGKKPDQDEVRSSFYEIACLADYEENKHGLITTYKISE